MAVRFTVRNDGIIEAHCDPVDGLLDHALNDAVGSRAPRGARNQGLSTHWIDHTESKLRLALAEGSTETFASGNVTFFRAEGERVVAAYDFDPDDEDAESMPVVDFLALLAEWRRRVIDAGGASGAAAALRDEPPARPMGPVT